MDCLPRLRKSEGVLYSDVLLDSVRRWSHFICSFILDFSLERRIGERGGQMCYGACREPEVCCAVAIVYSLGHQIR